jgi:diaminohydroxyphosphoribosylaminopyrimidine deaminase/5-amino-6-(5-phosphoribosylamino)uracil reductase
VAATEDPNPMVRGQGFAYLCANGVRVATGIGADRAQRLNQSFFTLMRERRPFVVLKAATSLDGCIAAKAGCRTQLTSAAANRHAHRLRAEVDAIAVGVGTILADDPLLTVRGVYRERPLARVILDRGLRTPPDARVLSTGDAGPVMIVTTAAGATRLERRETLEDRGAEIEIVPDSSFRAALQRLAERGVGFLLLEGGGALHRAAWNEGLVDFVRLYVTPAVLGRGAVSFLEGCAFATADLVDRRVEMLGPDVLIEGYVHGNR